MLEVRSVVTLKEDSNWNGMRDIFGALVMLFFDPATSYTGVFRL